ncbi:MAG: M23 family metallopeptidase, partial [Pseudomonadota bacterium]
MFLLGWILIGPLWVSGETSADIPLSIECRGETKQGGILLCDAPPNSTLVVSGVDGEARRDVPVNADGVATIGLRRDEATKFTVTSKEFNSVMTVITLAERDDPFRTIEGLDCDKVDARTEEQKAHASRSWVKKQTAFKTFASGDGARNGFIRPSDGPQSSPFGPARKYIGIGKDGKPCERTSVHQGYDIAIPVGTEIVAPAAGTVTLADPDLYYEGGTVFLDHGEGLVSVFLHMSEVDVSAGDKIAVGERLSASGNT